MAEQSTSNEPEAAEEQSNGGNSGKNAMRAAAIAAATGATAIAAKKALSSRDQSGQAKPKTEGGSSGAPDESMLGEMLASGWGAAKDSLLPFAEEAADAAGEWVGRNGPDLVRDLLVPRFIRGFERTRESTDTEE